MHTSILRLLGFGSPAPSSKRTTRKNQASAFRPTLELLEARALMSVSMVQQPLSSLAVSADVQGAPIAVLSIQQQPPAWPEGFRPVAPRPPGPPNVNSGPTTGPFNPDGPEPYRLWFGNGAGGIAATTQPTLFPEVKVEKVNKDTTKTTITLPGGGKIVIEETKYPGNTITLITYPDGSQVVIEKVINRGGSTTTTYFPDGATTVVEEKTGPNGGSTTTTTESDAKGKVVKKTVKEVNPDGSATTTTTTTLPDGTSTTTRTLTRSDGSVIGSGTDLPGGKKK